MVVRFKTLLILTLLSKSNKLSKSNNQSSHQSLSIITKISSTTTITIRANSYKKTKLIKGIIKSSPKIESPPNKSKYLLKNISTHQQISIVVINKSLRIVNKRQYKINNNKNHHLQLARTSIRIKEYRVEGKRNKDCQ